MKRLDSTERSRGSARLDLRDIVQAAMAGIYPSQQALEAMLDRIERMP